MDMFSVVVCGFQLLLFFFTMNIYYFVISTKNNKQNITKEHIMKKFFIWEETGHYIKVKDWLRHPCLSPISGIIPSGLTGQS